jgi:hypothetical protein
VKRIAGKFDTRVSDIQLPGNFISSTKETIHNILELPLGGLEVVPYGYTRLKQGNVFMVPVSIDFEVSKV